MAILVTYQLLGKCVRDDTGVVSWNYLCRRNHHKRQSDFQVLLVEKATASRTWKRYARIWRI